MAEVNIVSCGPGGELCLTLEAIAVADSADVLIGTARLLQLFPEAGCEKVEVHGSIKDSMAAIDERPDAKVVVLVSGDAGAFSLAKLLIKKVGLGNCHIVSGVSSIQVAFARVGLSWTDAKIITAHKEDPEADYDLFTKYRKIAVLGGRAESAKWIAGLAEHLGDEYIIVACENLTLPDERVFEVSVKELEVMETSLLIILIIDRALME